MATPPAMLLGKIATLGETFKLRRRILANGSPIGPIFLAFDAAVQHTNP